MNNIKISQLDENLSPSLSAVTVVVQNDIAKQATIQSIKETMFSDGLMVTGNTQIVNTWTTPNETEWKIVTYNGYYSGTATSESTYWFPFSGVPFSNGSDSCSGNDLRSGIIEYTAYFNGAGCGSEIGQIMFSRNCGNSNDNWIVSQQDCDNVIVTDGDSDGFYFYNDSNSDEVSMLIQWTARLFYTEENFC
jgi:hypothetical protein